MPKYHLVYFNMRGRAEPIRWIFALQKQEYEDERIEKSNWASKKKGLLYEKIPLLYVDGKPLSQSVNICRYLGKVFNLHADDPWEAACCDEVADSVHDLMPPAAKVLYAKRDGNLDEMGRLLEEFFMVVLPPFLKTVESRLEGKLWLAGDKMTWADIYTSCYVSQLTQMRPKALDVAPNLKSLIDRVLNLPEIAKWIKERPQTEL